MCLLKWPWFTLFFFFGFLWHSIQLYNRNTSMHWGILTILQIADEKGAGGIISTSSLRRIYQMMLAKLEAGVDANAVNSNTSSGRYAKILAGPWWAQFRYGSNPWMARYVYSVMFLLANLLAWAVRDYGPAALTEMNSKIYSYHYLFSCLTREWTRRTIFQHFSSLVSWLVENFVSIWTG